MTTPKSANDEFVDAGTRGNGAARSSTADAFATAREKVGSVAEDVTERLGKAVETTRDAAETAGRRAVDGIQDNPVAALVGGLALGAIAAVLLPRTEREVAAFGALGTRINGAAKNAASAAKTAGYDKLDELGLTRDRAQETVSKLFADVAKAATSAGGAAIGSVRQS